jgi:DNA-binding transcriptional ArsR family regulator
MRAGRRDDSSDGQLTGLESGEDDMDDHLGAGASRHVRGSSTDGDRGWFGRAFFALANDDRLAIVAALGGGTSPGQSITQIAASAGLNRFSASRHLGILRDAGIVRAEKDGVRIIHQLNIDGLDSIEDWLYSVKPQETYLPDVREG